MKQQSTREMKNGLACTRQTEAEERLTHAPRTLAFVCAKAGEAITTTRAKLASSQ